MFKVCLISLALVAIVAISVQAQSYLIDQNGADLESIAQAVCDTKRGTSKQIGHGSTIIRLASFFAGLPSDHKLAGCSEKFAFSLDRLASVLSAHNDNVCGDAKLSAIEEFHRDFVSKLPKHVKSRKSRHLRVPKLAKLFFLHYATEVSSICARDSLKQMKTFKVNSGDDQTQAAEIDSALERFQEYIGTGGLEASYKELFLPWLLVDGLPIEKYSKAASFVNLNGDKKLFIKTKGSDKLFKMQQMCSDLLRPIYSRVLLPVIRLISLGYYPTSEELAQQLAQKSPLKRLYVATQLCETILPIQLFEDSSLADEQITIVSAEEAANMDGARVVASESQFDIDEMGLTAPENSMNSIFSIAEDRAHSIVLIKGNVKSRGKGLRKIFKLLAKTTKSQLKSKLKKVFLKRGDQQEELTREDESVNPEEASRELARELGPDEDDDEDVHLRRRRRSALFAVVSVFAEFIEFCVGLILLIIDHIVCITQFFVVGGLILLYKLFTHITGCAVGDIETGLEFMWNFNNNFNPLGHKTDVSDINLTSDVVKHGRRTVHYIGRNKRIH